MGRGMRNEGLQCDGFVTLQGMFGIGQSTAKFINKETNIQTKFR